MALLAAKSDESRDARLELSRDRKGADARATDDPATFNAPVTPTSLCRLLARLALLLTVTTLVASAQISVSPNSLPNGVVGQTYNQTLAASGGTSPYSWTGSGLSGTGSAGLNFANGVISGTPTTAGPVSVSISIKDSASPDPLTLSTTINFIVYSPVAITTASLANAVINSPYDQALAASGGSGTYSWSGSLSGAGSAGLSLTAAGHVAGTPTAAGAVTVSATATDSANPGNSASKTLNFTAGSGVTITTTTLPNGVANSLYDQALSATGGSGTYSWSGSLSGAGSAGLSLTTAGHVAGTPTVAGAVTVSATASDSANPANTTSKSLSFTVYTPVAISTSSLPNAVVNSPYDQTLAATGGAGSYTWTGSLSGAGAAGLSLTAAGHVAGTPTAAGAVTVSATATDSANPGNSASKPLNFTVGSGVTITTTTLPNGVANSPYDQALSATGGSGTYSWSGSLSGAGSAGLSLTTAGHVAGTPTVAGAVTVSATASDSANPANTTSKSLSFTVYTPVAISTSSLPNAVVNSPYDQTLAATGGAGSYTWTGSLSGAGAAGLSLTAAGHVAGTPTAAGAVTVSATATDSANPGNSASKPLNFTVGSGVTITTTALPNGVVGTAYDQTLSANGGSGTYVWSGSLSGAGAAGLSLTAAGHVSGTPTATGAVTVSATATDSANSANAGSKSLTFTVYAAVAITNTTLPSAVVGQSYDQALAATGGAGTYTWSGSLSGTGAAGLSLTAAGHVTGTPSSAGPVTVSATVVDAANISNTASKIVNLTVQSAVKITTATLPNGIATKPYDQTLAASGGSGSYTWSGTVTGAGAAGLSLNAAGHVIGTPTTSGTVTVAATAIDSANSANTNSKSLNFTVVAPVAITTTALSDAVVGVAYDQTLTATGGSGSYTWSGSLSGPGSAGLSLTAAGHVSGTPTSGGSVTVSATVTDTANSANAAPKNLNFTVNTGVTITTASLPDAVIGKPYSQALAAAGGNGTYTWSGSISGSGSAGLSFTNGQVTGTPAAAGGVSVSATVSDTATPPNTSPSKVLTFNVYSVLAITTSSLPSPMVGVAYDQPLVAAGGTGTYAWSGSVTGTGAAGLSFNSAGHVVGTPTVVGSISVSATVTDNANPAQTASANLATTINPPTLTITTASLAAGAVGAPYSQTLTASGGTPPYSWSGSPPSGLTLTTNGTLAGTPSAAGTFNVAVHLTDSQSRTADRTLSLQIYPAVVVTACPSPTAVINQPYSSSATATGGATPYTWSLSSGVAPPGLQLSSSSGLLSGTPLQSGSFAFTVRAADPTGSTATRTCSLNVASIPVIPPQTLADAVVGTSYRQVLVVNGGTSPYSWSVITGSLPPGLAFASNGVISGTATLTGLYSFRLGVEDANAQQTQAEFTLYVASGLTITACPVNTGTVGASYSSAFSVADGQSPFRWTLTAGSLPQGITLDAATGALHGTPTAPGTSPFTGRVTDASGATSTRQCSIAISAALAIATTTLPAGNVGVDYSANLAAAGGTTPYQWSLPSGALPPGLALSQTTGQISGSPTNAGSFSFTARVADTAGATRDASFTITVTAGFAVAACPAPAATTGVPYASTLNAVGGQSPYTWSIGTGSLPAGLALNGNTGVITGTPTTIGTSDFTVSAKDTGGATASRACNISTVASSLSITSPATLPRATAGVAYSESLTATGGQTPYTWAVIEGSLPAGIQLSSAGVLSGTPSATGDFTFAIRVADSAHNLSQQVFHLTVAPAEIPTISFSGVPDITSPAQQIYPIVVLDAPYPADITGTMTVSFTPDPGLVDDTDIKFTGDGRSVTFTIPAGQIQSVFSSSSANGLQTGTVAGTLQLGVTMQSGGVDITPSSATKQSRVDRLAPQISSVQVTSTSGGFTMEVVGYSTTRDVTQGTFTFTPASGSSLTQSTVTVPMTSAAQEWFSSDGSKANFGGQFLLTMPFTLQGATLSSVSVTLTNGQGTSAPVSTNF